MKKLAEIKTIIKSIKPQIKNQYHITELGIFGSYIRGEENENSDIDILINYAEAPSLFELIDLELYISECVGIKADVVTKNGLKQRYKDKILAEVIYIN